MKRLLLWAAVLSAGCIMSGYLNAGLQEDLFNAAISGKVGEVEALVAKGADVNGKNAIGNTPLVGAASSGKIAVVASLIKAGANTNLKGHDGLTPLMLAAMNGDEAMTRLLIEKGANSNETGKEGETALIYAADRGHLGVVRVLLKDGKANVNMKENAGRTPLMLAASAGYLEVAKILMEAGAVIDMKDKRSRTALDYAVTSRKEKVAELLRTFKSEPSTAVSEVTIPESLKEEIARKNKAWKVKIEVEHQPVGGQLANIKGYVLSILKLKANDQWEKFITPDFVGQLLRERVNEGWFTQNDLFFTLRNVVGSGTTLMAEILIKAGVGVNSVPTTHYLDNKTALMSAAGSNAEGRVEMIRLLISLGADVNMKDKQGRTALGYATLVSEGGMTQEVKNEGKARIELLRKHGAVL